MREGASERREWENVIREWMQVEDVSVNGEDEGGFSSG